MEIRLTAGREDAFEPAAAASAQWSRPSVRLTALALTLTCIGLVGTASAAHGTGFLGAAGKRLVLTGVGLAVFAAASRLRYQWWRRHSLGVLLLAFAGLAAVLVPGVGVEINSARRWINPGLPVGFQPSEFAKIALCIWVAAYCERNATRMRSPVHGFLAPLGVVGAACLLILCEPDFGTAVLAGAVCMAVLLAFGTRIVFVLLAFVAGMPLLQKLIFEVPYRRERVLAFLNPWSDPQGSGYQLIQSKIAIGSGGLFGRGLGAGVQKAGFLPGADNDFIFSILAEELGLLGSLLVIGLFVLLLWEGLRVVLRSRDPFGFGLGLGLSWLIGMQAAAHIAVVTGSVPTKGLSLPFISAGGSSLVASLLAAGILVSIARSEEEPAGHPVVPWQDDAPAYETAVLRLARHALGTAREAAERLHRREE
jgi:cell division protein FtsW